MVVTTSIYNSFKSDVLTKAVSLTGDTILCSLYGTTAIFTATDTTYATTLELATANGYTQGGSALANKGVSGTTTVKWTANATQWTASGAGFTAYYAKLYSSTNSNRLIAHVDFGGAQTASGGGTFTITWDTNGIITLT